MTPAGKQWLVGCPVCTGADEAPCPEGGGTGRRRFLAAAVGVAGLALGAGKAQATVQAGSGSSVIVGGRRFDRDLVFRALPAALPLRRLRITSLFGLRTHPILGYRREHPGVDFGERTGTSIFSTATGIVTHAGTLGGYGQMVEIRHTLGFSSRYAHMSRISVAVGQTIDRGTIIGTVGSTGMSTGPHLHYEILQERDPIDPIRFILVANDAYRRLGVPDNG